MVRKSLADGRAILEHLDSFGVPVYIVPGNWDWTPGKYKRWAFLNKGFYDSLVDGLHHIVNTHHRLVDADTYQIIGHGITSGPEYPQTKEDIERYTPRELVKVKKDYDQQYRTVDILFRKASKPVIFMPHNVPYNTPLDKIVNPDSPRNGQHFGSLIARQIIDKHQPLVCIGGHMHEHFRKCTIGKTTAINAGFGSYVNVMLELEGAKIRNVTFHRGRA